MPLVRVDNISIAAATSIVPRGVAARKRASSSRIPWRIAEMCPLEIREDDLTGTEIAPARAFYVRHGFEYGGPFAEYADDPNSVFMTKGL